MWLFGPLFNQTIIHTTRGCEDHPLPLNTHPSQWRAHTWCIQHAISTLQMSLYVLCMS
jgi:hypothetical protein